MTSLALGDTRLLTGVLAAPTPYLFFTGKGGVGKTSCAAATAVALADAGRRVLIVSTDPASNLAEVFGMPEPTSSSPEPVPGVPGLDVVDIDPAAAAAEYRERVVGPYRGLLPADAVASIEEELSGSCTVEVAAFNEFVTLLTSEDVAATYDHVVFDTAPTGHTLRLLALPAAWTGFLETNTAGVTCVGPVSALGHAQESYAASLAALRDRDRTTVVLVARAEASSLLEAARAATDLADLGMTQQRLVINGVLAEPAGDDTTAIARRAREAAALDELPAVLSAATSVDTVPLLARAPIGVAALRAALAGTPASHDVVRVAAPDLDPLGSLVDELAEGEPCIVMTMGKGGVGKTTIAAAIALALADRGLPVTLTTTDPAAHITGVLPDPPANLDITRLDPVAETAAWTEHVLATAGAGLDDAARDLLTEDLRSPCTEEVAVFHAFARTVADAADRFVVIDTAPTGHTLLLLESSQSFARQAVRGGGRDDAATSLFASLADPERTRIVLVALPEATPVHEALALQADLARSGLRPWTWVANSSLAATGTTDPVLRARAADEARWLSEITEASPRRPVIVPWMAEVPAGAGGLRRLTG
ncbi:arsenical pump-driving ATPase [Actinotalea fermentans]|uniref:Arsenical pump-driving ATPase n=1 Tax=Actinotalea fermentans TaxID=43671 RepID=A0A511YYN0_9CELL|nr:arsenical pump-driving ATPase [Actinotalea fermentans]KGM17809.1 arsenic ABC transporter ATPase [Actinotalea fermentans ATCC 43279 = JCM 9966 = DSM 3133]GEN80298.1 arsenical pump-driving ATPase [Actinotalea fermentans]